MKKVSDIIHIRNIRILIDNPYLDKGYPVELDSKEKGQFTFEMSSEEFRSYTKKLIQMTYSSNWLESYYLPFKDSGGFYEKYLPEVLL